MGLEGGEKEETECLQEAEDGHWWEIASIGTMLLPVLTLLSL